VIIQYIIWVCNWYRSNKKVCCCGEFYHWRL